MSKNKQDEDKKQKKKKNSYINLVCRLGFLSREGA